MYQYYLPCRFQSVVQASLISFSQSINVEYADSSAASRHYLDANGFQTKVSNSIIQLPLRSKVTTVSDNMNHV